MNVTHPSFAGLDLLASAVLLIDDGQLIRYINAAGENLLAVSGHSVVGKTLAAVCTGSATLQSALDNGLNNNWGYTGQNIELVRGDGEKMHLNCTVTPLRPDMATGARLLLELQPIEHHLAATREERLIEQQQASRELIRNLAHEIKNPLGGIRGAAQLLEYELPNPALKEYTQVIIKEADRLQDLMQRLLRPHRPMLPATVNIHEILERVRSLLKAEFPGSLQIVRDYDTSLPELIGDREQLIQCGAGDEWRGRNRAAHPYSAPSDLGQKALQAGDGTQGARQRPGHSRRYSRAHVLSAGFRAGGRQRPWADHCAKFRSASSRHNRLFQPSGSYGVYAPSADRAGLTRFRAWLLLIH